MFADGMRQRRCLIPADCYYCFIHNWMPMILPYEDMTDWLNPRFNGAEVLTVAIGNMAFSQC